MLLEQTCKDKEEPFLKKKKNILTYHGVCSKNYFYKKREHRSYKR